MSRWKAASIHFGLSATVVIGLAALLAATWYPPVYAWAMGGLGLLGILTGVDVCLGPLLTLIVFDLQKPSLRFDITVIVLLQVLALGYGLHTIYLARPVYLVFTVDGFDLISANNIPLEELAKVEREEFKSLPLTGPKVIAVRKPTDIAERSRILHSALAGGADLQNLPQYYVPYTEMLDEIRSKAQPVTHVMEQNAQIRETLAVYLKKKGLDSAKIKALPLRARSHDQTVLIDGDSGAVLDILNLSLYTPG